MPIDTGPIMFALLTGVVLAAAAAWAVATLFRRRMLSLMRSQASPSETAVAGRALTIPPPMPGAAGCDATANRQAFLRQLIAWTAVSALIGLTHSALALLFVYPGTQSLNRWVLLGLIYAWPMVMAWGLLQRWSWLRTSTAIVLYMLAMTMLTLLRSTADQSLAGVAAWLGGVVAIPVLVTLLIGASGRIRAVAPYLMPFFVLLAAGSVHALAVVAGVLDHEPPWLLHMLDWFGAWGVMAIVVFAPWLLLGWPLYTLARRLAKAYRQKRFSDLTYLLGMYWLVVLFASALPGLQSVGALSLTQLLPWLWIPVAHRVLQAWLTPREPPASLLVLRVFHQDEQVERLFDRVIERWRLTGNTMMIAGTDLISRTIDPDELFAFIDKRLAQRFVADEAQLAARVADFDFAPDPDGRYRVNECYCFDSTWQAALTALVGLANVVLMDLRGFQAHNAGCRYELAELARAPAVHRVVVLYDQRTALDTARADTAGAPADRFAWLRAGHLDRKTANTILRALHD